MTERQTKWPNVDLRAMHGDSVVMITSCPSIPSSIVTTGHLE